MNYQCIWFHKYYYSIGVVHLQSYCYALKFCCVYNFSDGYYSFSTILQDLRNNVTDANARSKINVRRDDLWAGTCRYFKKSKFNPKASVSVKFADSIGRNEETLDSGDLRMEYLRLLIRAINKDSKVFCGPEDNRVLVLDEKGTNSQYEGWYYCFILQYIM